MSETYREVHLASRPEGAPSADNFKVVERPLVDPGEGQFRVRNLFMTVDPYMRGRMRDVKSYVPPFQIDEALSGGCVGRVEASNHADFAEGDLVMGMEGWREAYLSDGTGQVKVQEIPGVPLSAYLGVLGMPGLTAYVGLLDIGEPKEGETVFVSGAAGAVGSLVGQIARIKGCHVAGSAGAAAKVAHLKDDLGFHAAFNYKDGSLGEQLREACPNGIDVYFENVGGDMLEAVLLQMNPFGRIPVCGMISLYNQQEPAPGPRSIIAVIPNRLKIQGFIVSDSMDRRDEFLRDVGGWLQEGKITYRETVHEGIDKAPEAFMGLFTGENLGKMIVSLA